MAHHAHEFQCTSCDWFNYPMLSDQMSGNFVVICGNCDHKHYRHIKDGVVTEVRHNSNRGNGHFAGHTVHVMKSASQKTKRKLGTVAQLRQKEAAGLHT